MEKVSTSPPQLLGDACLIWTLGEGMGEEISSRVLSLYGTLKGQDAPQGVLDLVPAYNALALHFDPLLADPALLQSWVEESMGHITSSPGTHSQFQLGVRYDGEDLDRVAELAKVSTREVVKRHLAPTYRVAMIGFLPHFPYLIGLDPLLETPRLESPRTKVPAGSVAIGGAQTGVYPCESPGGWNILGWTDPDALLELQPGDELRFVESKA